MPALTKRMREAAGLASWSSKALRGAHWHQLPVSFCETLMMRKQGARRGRHEEVGMGNPAEVNDRPPGMAVVPESVLVVKHLARRQILAYWFTGRPNPPS
jgi:hypothetical protein